MKFPDCLPKPLGPFYPLPAANVVLLLSGGGGTRVIFVTGAKTVTGTSNAEPDTPTEVFVKFSSW